MLWLGHRIPATLRRSAGKLGGDSISEAIPETALPVERAERTQLRPTTPHGRRPDRHAGCVRCSFCAAWKNVSLCPDSQTIATGISTEVLWSTCSAPRMFRRAEHQMNDEAVAEISVNQDTRCTKPRESLPANFITGGPPATGLATKTVLCRRPSRRPLPGSQAAG